MCVTDRCVATVDSYIAQDDSSSIVVRVESSRSMSSGFMEA
jgi:hypothetical protein